MPKALKTVSLMVAFCTLAGASLFAQHEISERPSRPAAAPAASPKPSSSPGPGPLSIIPEHGAQIHEVPGSQATPSHQVPIKDGIIPTEKPAADRQPQSEPKEQEDKERPGKQ